LNYKKHQNCFHSFDSFQAITATGSNGRQFPLIQPTNIPKEIPVFSTSRSQGQSDASSALAPDTKVCFISCF